MRDSPERRDLEPPIEASIGGPIVRWLGRVEYEPTWRAMQSFTEQRDASTADELWLLEHPSIFTLGLNADPKHVLAAGDIPVLRIDRGGQVTYHGPGQLIAYVLVDLKRARLGVRNLVTAFEEAVIDYSSTLGITAVARPGAPGVYVEGKKLASLGIRVRRGATYHGLALNVDMDLEPFSRINPCGFAELQMTQLRDLTELTAPGRRVTLREAATGLATALLARLAH